MNSPIPLVPPKVERSGNVTVITLTSRAVRDVENEIARELLGLTGGTETAGRHLLLDFTNVAYLNSMELGTLVTLHKQVKSSGGRLTLFNLGARVFRLFVITRLDRFLEICREGVVVGRETFPRDATAEPTPSGT